MPEAVFEPQYPYALEETLFSAQAFRWRQEKGIFRGQIQNHPIELWSDGGRIMGRLAPGLEIGTVAHYLRIDDPMPAIYRSISKDDHIRQAVRRWSGLHLLAQDPWETTVAFIASSASNVAKIQRSIEKVCRRFGERSKFADSVWHGFPGPEALARASLSDLRKCELGYRANYIRATARAVAEGKVDLEEISKMPTDAAKAALVENLEGIGPKVAGCILLFSMGKDNAFPVDRHVRRAVSERYFGGAPITERKAEEWGRGYFGKWAGYAQQYLFHERRLKSRLELQPPSRSG